MESTVPPGPLACRPTGPPHTSCASIMPSSHRSPELARTQQHSQQPLRRGQSVCASATVPSGGGSTLGGQGTPGAPRAQPAGATLHAIGVQPVCIGDSAVDGLTSGQVGGAMLGAGGHLRGAGVQVSGALRSAAAALRPGWFPPAVAVQPADGGADGPMLEEYSLYDGGHGSGSGRNEQEAL